MHKKASAPLAPWLEHHYLSKPGGGGGLHTRTGPGRPPPHDFATLEISKMTAITQQDMPQTDAPKLQHIPTTNRASISSTSYRIGITRFHPSAQETVGSGAFISAWLLLENNIPLQRWRKVEQFHLNHLAEVVRSKPGRRI